MDWKEIYQQKKNGTYTPTPTATPASTGTTSATTGASDWRSIYEQKQNAKGSDVNAWISAANALISDYNTSSSMWEEEGEGFNSYLSERERLLTYADTFRNQYAGNEEALKYVDEVVGVLDSLPVNLFKTWDDVWRDKYQGQSHDELQSVLGNLEEGSDERKWLEEYSWSGDVMTVDDYQKLIDEKEAELDFFKKNNAVDGYATANDEQGNLHGTYDDEIAAAKAELERLKTGQWRLENEGKYGAISQNADFASMSAPRLDEYGKWGNSTYHYINDENVQKAASAQGMRAGGARSEERKGYDLMTEDEVEMYNYLYHVSGKKAAEEYLDYLSYELAARRTQQISDVNAQIATDSPWLASAMSIPANLMSGIGYVDVAGQNVVKGITEAVTGEYAGPINYNSAAMAPSVMSTSIRSTVAQNLANKHGVIALDVNEHPVLSRVFNGKSWGDVYQLGMSMADSTTTALLAPFIGTAGTVLLGGSAATQGMLDAVANGATDGQALTVGFINGAAEWAFEKIGMDNLVNKIIRGDKAGIVRALISQGLAEGGEELGTSIVNTIADHLIMAEKSGYSRMIEEYKAQGMSPEEAAKRALQDIAIGMGWDFVGGMLSGGIMGGGGHVIGSTIQNAEAKKLYGSKPTELVERVLELDPNNAFAQEMQSKLDSGKKLSGSEIRRLAQQAGDTKGSQESFDTEEAVEDDLTELDETEEDTLEDEYVSEQEMDEGTGPINVDEYSRIVEQAQIEEASEESSVTEQQVEPMAVEENAMSAQESVTEAREAPAAQSLEIEDELDAALAFLDAAPKYESSESTKAVEQTTESREAPAKATTIEEASKKYGAQAKAMSRTYHAGQDVAKYDAAYSKVFEIGKANGSLSFAKKMASAAYLTEAQVELAYEAGQAAAGIQPKTESAKPGAVSEKDEFISDTLASFKNVYGNDIVISDEEIRSVLGEAFDRGENMVQAAKAAKKANQAAIDAQVSAKYETQRKANEEARAKKEAEAAKEAETYADDDWGAWDDEPTSTKSEETEVQTETFTGVDVERTEYSPEDAQKTIQSILNSNKEGRGDIKAEEISCIIDNTYLRDAFAAEAGYTLPWERSKAARAIFEASDTDSSKWSEVSAEGFKRSDILADDRTKDGDLMPAMFANAAGMLLVENGLDVPWNIDALSDSEAVEILQSRKPGKGAYAQELARMTANIRARSVSLSGNQNSRLVDQKFAGDKVSTPQMAVLAYVPRILDGDGNARMSTAEWIKQAFNTGNEGDYAEGIDSLIYDYAQALRVKELIRGGTRLGQLEGKVPQKILDLYRAIEERGLYAKVTPHGSVQGGINEPGRIKVDRKPVAQSKQAPRTANETKAPAAPKATAAKPAASTKVTQTATKAVITAKNEEVSIKRIASVENGEMTLELADGRIISANDVSITADGEALIYETVASMGVDAEAANKLVSGYDSSITAEAYAAGIQEAFRSGMYNIPAREMRVKGSPAAALNATQRNTAYRLGQEYSEKSVARKQVDLKEAQAGAKAAKAEGKVHFEGDRSTLTKRQSASLAAIEKVAEALGIQVYVFESEVVDGKRVGANGWFDPKDSSIHIDLYAGQNGEATMLFTASHELVHFIKKWSPAKFKTLANFLMDQYGQKGISVETLVHRQIEKAQRKGRTISYDTAYEEVIADSMETMLADGNVAEKLAVLKAQDQSLWNKIKEFFSDLIAKIREVYEGMTPNSAEGRYVAEMVDSLEQLQQLFVEGLTDASANYTIGSRNMADFAAAQNTNGDPLFQYRAMEADEATYRDMLQKWGKLTETQINNLFATIDKAMEIIKDNLEALDYAWEADINDRAFSPVKPNSDSLYQVSLDFSTLCRKRLLQQAVQAQLQEALNKPLTREEGIAIRDALMAIQEEGRQIEVACALCYVESARMKSPAQIKKFMNNREAVIKNYFASKNGGEMKTKIAEAEAKARAELGVGDTPLKKLPGKTANAIRSAKKAAKASYVPTAAEQKIIDTALGMKVSDFTSPEGLENLAKNHPELFDAYTSYIRNATKSKGIENDTWWRAGDSERIGDTLIANMNKENGLRSQSWSDFQVIHLLDYIAATIELSTRNAKEQAYSKVPDYVELMGQTGVMINMSLIPTRTYSGKLEYDNVEGIDYNRALELREKYPATAGTICIGITNEQIIKLLEDMSIDYVIPYHKSGMSAHIRKLMHLPGWDQYEDYQSEKPLDRNAAEKRAAKHGVKLLAESDPKYQKHTSFSEWFDLEEARQIAEMENAYPTDKAKQKRYGIMYGAYMAMQNAGNNYLKLCAERGLAPKFSHEKADFTGEENYWKLLIDRKMVNNATGEIIEQQTIKPIFDEAEVLRILNDELARYPQVKADQDYATRRVTEKFLSGELKGGMSAEAIAEVVKKPVDNIAVTSILASKEFGNGIERGMTDEARYEILKDRSISLTAKTKPAELDRILKKLGQLGVDPELLTQSDRKRLFKKIGEEFGVFKEYENADVHLVFEFSKRNLSESLSKQKKNYADYAKMLSCFDRVIDSAVGIEVHNRNSEGYKPDPTLKDTYVLVSAFEDGEYVVPVKLEIKEFFDKSNSLYVAISLESIKKDEVVKQGDTINGVTQGSRSSIISLADLFSKVNPSDTSFLKYIPGGFLTEVQEEALKLSDRNSIAETEESDVRYSLREEAPPKKKQWGFKLMVVDEKGLPHAMFIDNAAAMNYDDWYNADSPALKDLESLESGYSYLIDSEGNSIDSQTKNPSKAQINAATESGQRWMLVSNYSDKGARKGQKAYYNWGINGSGTVSKFALRPGLHAVDIPSMRHIGAEDINPNTGKKYKAWRRPNQRWFLIEYPVDVDYNAEAYSNPTKDIPSHLPKDGWYSFQTNSGAEAKQHWFITGAMRIVGPVSEADAARYTLEKGEGIQPDLPYKDGVKDFAEDDAIDLYEYIRTTDAMPTPTKSEMKRRIESGEVKLSDRSTDSLSNRSLLANAFESVAQNDIERERIREYKKKIDLVNAEEQKLQRLRAEIKKLSFAKGPRDAKRISKLQDEATKTANRISVYDQQLLRLEASKPLQAVVEREKAKAKKLAEKKGREALAAYREKAAQTQQKMLERYRESRSNAKIGRDKTAMRHKIKDIVDELNNYLLKGTKDKHVMIGLQKAVASALDVVNMDTVGAEERLKALSEKMAKETDPIKLNDLLASYRRIMEQGEKMSEKLQNLRAAYAEIKDSSDPLIANSHDEVIEAAIEAVAKNVGETPLRDMTLEQLQDVYDLYKMVLTTIRTSNKSFKADKKKSIDSLASSVQAEVEEVGGKKKFGLKNFGAVNSFLWNNFKPVYAFKAIGSKTLSRLFNNVRAGEDVWAKDVSAAKAFYLEQSKKHGYDSWDLEKTHTFTSTTGMDFKLTLEQIMSLYAYSKRKQAEDHLKFGGIVFEDSFETKKLFGKFDIKLKTEDATAYNISPETLAAITATLTADQKAFVDAMQDYLSTTMGEKGNEVSLEMYGVKLFKEKFYFPLKSATQYMAKAREQAQGDVKIKNKGFTKDTNPKAKNPIVLESFMDVWASHVNEMSMYHAFTLPLEDFYRVYNYKTPSVNENMPTEGVNPAIQNAYGKAATKYIEQLLRDLNGGARSDPTAGFINKMMGLFKKGAVFASASVVIQQPSAVARAMALVDSKYFIGKKLDDHKHKALWEEVKQYAPVAMIKEMGYFDTNMGMSTVDFIKAKEYESWDEKMKALVTDGDYRDEVLSKAPALADEIAWCMIWEAVKRETIDKHPALKATSEEFLQLAGARFTEVIVNTQVYDSVLSRSANMRSKDTGMKMATAFLAEPTTNINMIADALVQGKRGDKKQARKAIGAVMASQILNAILVSFVYAGRDDDDEKTYWEKYFASVLAEVKDSFNLASYIPFLKDIVSIVQGYDVERSDIAVIADIWKAYEQLDSDSLSGWRKVENFVGGIASLFGLPVKNIMRDARALYQTVDLAINGEKTTAAGMKYAIKEALTGEEVKNADQLLEALIDGDEAHAERVMGRFEDESKANTALRSSIKSGFTGGRFDADAAVEMLVDYTDMDEDDAYWKVQEWLAGGEEFSRYGRVFDAVRNGGNFNSAMDELVAHGYDEKEVLSKVKGQIGTWYKEGEITRQQATQMLGRYMDMESEDITKTVDKWEFARDYGYSWEDRSEAYSAGEISREELITSMMEVHDIDRQDAEYEVAYLEFQMNYPEFDLAKSTYLAYHRDIDKIGMSLAEAGIDIGVYAMYSENKKGVSGKANILPIIDALPITPAQKDAIYYKEGWASSTIWDTPWHR